MKNFYLVWRHCLLMVLGCFICLSGFAQLTSLEPGKVYRFVNRMYPGYSMTAGSMTTAIGAATVESSKSQLWYVAEVSNDGGGVPRYRLRSFGNGRYLQGAGGSTQWKLVESTTNENTYLYLRTVGTTYNTLSLDNTDNNRNKMHCDGSKNIVGWSVDGQATHWTITEVDFTADAIEANWAAIDNFVFTDTQITNFKASLAAIFTDAACTTLNATYAAMSLSELQADAHYTVLPATLRNMVTKVWNEQSQGATAWGEDHVDGEDAKAWSGDYAKRYRVQNYEIYTNRDCVNSALKINIHTNLNNPTGIITKERDALYIMVDGEIKEGASLYLGSYSGHGQAGNATDGVQLQTGLNVVPCFVDKQWTCIYYTANTMKAWDGATNKGAHPLSFYPDLKIHIEGGHVNGYYNEVGDALYAHGRTVNNEASKGDNEEDWDYLAARNVLDDITIVGKRIVFQFNFKDPVTESGATCKGTEYYFTADENGDRRVRITDFLERWNRIVWAQNLTMGLESAESVAAANRLYPTLDNPSRGVYAYTGKDKEYASSYEDYYRMHCLAIGIPTGYMSGGWTSSNYNYGTFQAIIEGITTNAGNTWGPGHEIGHQHQGPINMNGLTEVTNNLFANVCVWYDGRATSRTNSGEGDLSYVLKAYNEENSDFFTNNIWAQTQMYYKLWLYYHLVGHNNKFYPRLFEMLRRDPITRTYNQLDVQADENGTVVTGKTPLLHFYKKCCLAAGEDLTEFFRAYGFFTPMNKRYVGDYASSEYTQTQAQIDATIDEVKALHYPENHTVLFINDCTGTPFYQHDGKTERSRLGDSGTYSDLGAYTDYNGTTSNDEVTGTYELTVANGNATMVGATGGAGFLIYDENGKLLSFSSDYTFPLSDEALIAIAKGTATVQVLNAEGASTPVVYDGASAAVSLLAGLLDEVKIVVDAVDDGGNSGTDYTKVGFYKKSEVTTLLSLYEEAKTLYEEGAQSGYVSAYNALKTEFDAVRANEFARVALVAGSTCVLVNKNVPTRYISETASNTVTTTDVTGGVVVANVPATGQWILEATTTSGAYNFKNVSTTNYWLALTQSEQLTTGAEKKSYTFLDNEDGSWGIKYSENSQLIHKAGGNNIVGWGDTSNKNSHWYITMVSKLQDVEASMNLEDLVAKTTTLMNKMANVSGKGAQDMSTFRITSNVTEQGHGTELMVDGDLTTFFHTVWSGTEVNENHYFQIDCGEGLSLGDFVLSYTTRPSGTGGNDAPTNIIITGSNTTDAEGNVTGWEDITTLSEGLPTGKAASYTSDIIGSSSNTYRYLRFTVTTASGGTFGGQYYFGIAELGISRPEAQVNSIVEKYAADALGGNQLTNAKLIAADDALYASKQLLANGGATEVELTAQYETLKAQYDILLATYNAAESADLSAAQTALQQVINNTQTLLDECGSVSIVKAKVTLQSTDENASGYLYCNAPYQAQQNGDYSVQGTDGYHLLDGNKATYLHTNYAANAGPGEDHYLRVYVGESGIGQFRMLYTTRNSGNGQPTKMVIEGSNDATGTYTEIAILTKDDASNPLPETTSTDYTSDYFEGGTYKYLRFRVLGNTASDSKSKPDGHYWFCMAEFALEKKASTTITNNNVGTVMDDEILTTYNAIESATTAKNLAKTVAQLNAAQAELQAQYDALQAAKTVVEGRESLKTAIDNATALKNSCYETDVQGNTVVKADYISNPNFSLEDLQNLERAISTAITVFRKANATDDEVEAQETALAAAMTQLNRSFDYMALPITLTTNTNNPVLYTIHFQRDATPYYLQYRGDESHGDYRNQYDYNKLKYNATLDRGNIYQAFYFTRGTVGARLYMNAAADNKVFSVITGDLAAGPGKVKAFAADEAIQTFDAREWTISASANNDGWFNIAPAPNAATPLYLHNWNGITENPDNIGFDTDADNPGSLFKFASYQEADKTALNSALATLNTAYAACFSDPECTIINSEYDGSLNLTQDNLDKVKAVINAARAVSADELAYQSSVDEQTALVEAQTLVLQNLVAYAALPVKLTTDPAAPHYYRIYVNRSGRPLWQARTTSDPSSTKVQLTTAYDLGIDRQAWYFTAASEAPKLYIVNKNTTDRVLACTTGDFAVGAGKLQSLAVDDASVGANEWTITNEASQSGWYNITTVKTTTAQDGSTTNTTFYISNHGGVKNNMGFYNNSSDEGSNFQFVEIDPTRSAAYNTLYNYFHDKTKVKIDLPAEPPAFPADKIHDTAIGYYSSSLASNYLSAYVHAYFYLEYGGEDSYLTAAYEALVAANEALVTNAIDFDAYYVLRNAHTGYCNNAVAYANVNDHKVYWHAQKNKVETPYTVDLNNGSDNKEASNTFWKQWTSTATPSVTFSVTSKNIATSESNLVIYSGTTNAPFKLNAPTGYVIDSYSVTFANNGHDVAQTLTFSDEGVAYQTTRAAQTYTVANSGKSSVTITLTGTNQGVKLTDFTVKIRPSFTENEAVNVWKFEQVGNNAYLKNLHTGTYLTNAGTQYGARQLSTTGQPVTFNILGDGQLNIKVNGSQMHAQADGSAVVAYPGGKNTASAWYVEKVAAPEEITTRINMTQYQKASLYLAYPAIIPEGIKAYYAASEADATIEGTSGGSIYLTLFEGNVLPAGTPVILKGAQGAYKFDLSTTDEGTSPASNLFQGSAYKKLVQGEDGYKYYLFGVKTVDGDKKVGLYWAWLEYLADGTISNAGTDDGGYFYVPANKIYLPWNTASGAAPAFYFNFDGTTTGVDGIENVWDRNTGIYDLQGRRVNRIEQSGIYVINGQKRFVKVNGR
ncbi:MAG: M60 family metallopeptidase [Prevotellamassilia sp.]|nr:M60 family metallopeptidase [Prevotellamassilia sp.]